MSIPMQVSIPLALHLRSPVRFNLLTNEHWNHGEVRRAVLENKKKRKKKKNLSYLNIKLIT